MTHIMVLLWAVVLAAGITAVALTWIRWRYERLDFLRHYRRFLAGANLAVGGLLVVTYLAANLGELISPETRPSPAPFFLLGSFWLVAAFVYEFLVVSLTLMGIDLTAPARRRIVTLLGVAPVALLAGLALASRQLSDIQVFALSEVLNVTLVVAGMATILSSLVITPPPVQTSYRRAVRWFCVLHLGAFALIAVAALFAYPPAWFLLIGSFLLINLTPFVLLETLILQRKASPPAGATSDAALLAFAIRHDISEREREIVRLLLGGYTNQQIADELSISSHTVKNHVYNVYCKVGVKNRVQLANLVLGVSGRS